MPLPIVNPPTRPIDYVGAALEAFQQVSGEMRADRQVSLRERESAAASRDNLRTNALKDRQFREGLIDTAITRQYEAEDQNMDIQKFQFEMEQAQWERENVAPLELDVLRTRADANRALAESRRYQIQTEGQLQGQFSDEFNAVNSAIQGLRAGPADGEDEAAYFERVRSANAALTNLDKTWGKVRNPAVPSALAGAKSLLNSLPGYRLLQDRKDLSTAEEKAADRERREAALVAMLPFRSDADKDRWMASNQGRLSAWMKLDSETFGRAITAEADRLKDDPTFGAPDAPKVDTVARRSMETELRRAELAIIAAEAKAKNAQSPLEIAQAATEVQTAREQRDFLRRQIDPEGQSVIDRARNMPAPRSPGEVRARAAGDPLEFTPTPDPAQTERDRIAAPLFDNPPN